MIVVSFSSEHNLFGRPTPFDSHPSGGVGDAGDIAPRLQGAGHLADGDVESVASVAHVFGRGDPSAVGGFVVPCVGDAVDLVTRGTLAHVGKEVGGGVPSVTDGDAFGTPVLEVLVGGFVAPTHHGSPRTVGARVGCPVRLVGMPHLASPLQAEAPTGLGRPVPKARPLGCLLDSTRTQDLPQSLPVPVLASEFQHGETFKDLPREIDAKCHPAPIQPLQVQSQQGA